MALAFRMSGRVLDRRLHPSYLDATPPSAIYHDPFISYGLKAAERQCFSKKVVHLQRQLQLKTECNYLQIFQNVYLKIAQVHSKNQRISSVFKVPVAVLTAQLLGRSNPEKRKGPLRDYHLNIGLENLSL